MAFTPPNDAVAHFTPPSDADVFTPPSDAKYKTTVSEDIRIGLEDVGHTALTGLQMAGGGLTSAAGFTDQSDRVFAEMDRRRKEREEYKKTLDQGLGGQIISGITSVAPMIAAAPFVGPVSAAGMVAGAGALESGATNIEHGMGASRAIPQAIIEGATDTAAFALPMGRGVLKGAALGAGGNVASQGVKDISGQLMAENALQASPYQFDRDKYIVTGATGAVPGAVFGRMNRTGALEDNTPKPKAETPPVQEDVKLPTESLIMDKVGKQIDAELKAAEKAILDIHERGSFKPEEVTEAAYWDDRIKTLLQRKAEVLAGSDDPVAIAKVKEQLEAEYAAKKQEAVPSVEEPVLKQEVQEKTTPTEVGLIKVEEAKQMSPEELSVRIAETEEKLANTPEEKSAIREGLTSEIAAYKEIQQGIEPDLTRFGVEAAPTSVAELLTRAGENHNKIVESADANPHLFNKTEGASFDKKFQETTAGKMAEKILNHFLDITGLAKDNTYFIHDPNLKSIGLTEYSGDTGLIRINLDKMDKFTDTSNVWKSVAASHLVGPRLKSALTAFMVVRVGAHEIGHMLLTKYLKGFVENKAEFDALVKKFDDFKQNNRSTNASIFDLKNQSSAARYRDRQAAFHEFFAEEVTKKLMYQHTLGAFTKGSKTFKGLIDMSIRVLEEQGMKVDRPTFAQDMINDILTMNKETIAQYQQTIWEKIERKQNDMIVQDLPNRPLFASLSLEDVLNYSKYHGMLDQADPFMGVALDDAGTIGMRAIDALGSGKRWLARKTLGKERLAELNAKSLEVYNAMRAIRDSEEEAASIVNRLWNGIVDTKNLDGMMTLFKQKNPDSPFAVMSRITDKQLFELLELYKKGFDEGLTHDANLIKNGLHLTQDQVTNYNILSKLFKEMGETTQSIQGRLDKKHIMSIRDGWFPSVRQGRYSVTVGFGDVVAHREHFNTQLQAEKFRDKLLRSNLGRANISDVLDSKTEGKQTNQWMAEKLAEVLSRNGMSQSKEVIQRTVDMMNERGGKMGHHHEFRQGITGFKGDEFYKTPEQLGKSFREAIEQSVTEKGNQIKSMLINDKVLPTLDNIDYKQNYPESHAVIEQMYKSALGRNTEISNISDFVHNSMNKITDDVFKILGKELTSDKDVIASSLEATKTLFYFTKMIPSVAFSIVGQYINVLPGTVSRASYGGHGLMAYKSFAKGMTKLAVGDTELWNAIKEDSQKYNVFTASFIESMDMHKAQSPLMTLVKDWVLLQKPAQVADSFSRVMSYAVLYTHHRDLGKSDLAARREARLESDAIMNVYDRANSAPIFDHMGVVGDMIKPLQGFGQNMLGNIFRSIQYMDAKDYKTWGPFINYMALTWAMTGMMGLPGIQEYEMLRRWLSERFEDFSLPSIIDIVGSDEGIVNRIIPLDKQQRQQLYLGLLATGSDDDNLGGGIDWAKSGRTNATLYTILAGVIGGVIADPSTSTKPLTATPILDWATSVPGDLFEIGKYLGGGGSVASAKKAVENVAPSGHIGYGIKELMGLNTTKVMGENTEHLAVGKEGGAGKERTKADIWAGLAGTKSTEQKWQDQITMENALKEKQIQTKKSAAASKYVETKDPKYLKKMVELGMDEDSIQTAIETEVYNRSVNQTTRQIVNKQGEVTQKGARSAQRIFGFGRNE